MNFIKGVIVGGMVTAGVVMIYTDSLDNNKKKIMKKGRRIAKRIGMM